MKEDEGNRVREDGHCKLNNKQMLKHFFFRELHTYRKVDAALED